jgi:uroporphyrinogen-III synthase
VRKLLLLRPQPGLTESASRAAELGLEVIARPLFQVEPVNWQAPDPNNYDALLLTSANAVRHAGKAMKKVSGLPVFAVGSATAEAALEAGLTLAGSGRGGVTRLLQDVPETLRLLHLAGEHRRKIESRHSIDSLTVYRSAAIGEPGLPPLQGLVAAVHSPRAAVRLAQLAAVRDQTAIAAISLNTADACGRGWERVEVAAAPGDPSLLALAAMLCHTSAPG